MSVTENEDEVILWHKLDILFTYGCITVLFFCK